MGRNWNDDPFTKKARKENFEARSVYKLEEIDKRDNLFSKAKIVVDLGAAPGSWTQYVLRKLKGREFKIIACDLSPIQVTDPRLQFFQKSIEEMNWDELLPSEKADVVLSDMAPKTSGIHERDVALSLELSELALSTAQKVLAKGGNFVVKIFMGEGFEAYHKNTEKLFSQVKLLRPESTRKHSREIFLIGKGLK